MATYKELLAKAEALMVQAEQKRKEELASVVAEIKAKMKEYGLSVADLGGKGTGKAAAGRKSPAKYKGPNGELWSGGPGRKPEWVKQVLAAGKSLDAYLI